jgi:hypothetical protein
VFYDAGLPRHDRMAVNQNRQVALKKTNAIKRNGSNVRCNKPNPNQILALAGA